MKFNTVWAPVVIKVLGPIGVFLFKASKWPPDVAQPQVNAAMSCMNHCHGSGYILSDYKSIQSNCAVTSVWRLFY